MIDSPFARVPGFQAAGEAPKHLIDFDMLLTRQNKKTQMWRSEERLYVNLEGTAVARRGEPGADMLLVPAGGEITLDRAKELGLVDTPETESPEVPNGEGEEPAELTEEKLEEIAEARGLVLAPKAFVQRMIVLVGADEETGILAAVEAIVAERNGLLAGAQALREALELAEDASLLDAVRDLKLAASISSSVDAATVDTVPPPVEFSVPGLTHQAVEAIKAADLWSEEKLRSATDAELLALNGVAEGSLAKIREAFPPEG